MDLLEERIRKKAECREEIIGGQKVRWIYRSEMVDSLGLDNKHRNIWISFAVTIALGFGAFVWVKTNVVKGRKEEMAERERIRKELKLAGEQRKAIGIVSN